MRKLASVLTLGAVLATGCSGGSGVPSSPVNVPAPAASTLGRAHVLVTLHVPGSATTASTKRSPKFVSPGTTSVTVSTYGSMPVAGATPYASVNTNTDAGTCVNDNSSPGVGSGSRTCTIAIDAPGGAAPGLTDYFVFHTFSADNGGGLLLASATTSAQVVFDQNNTVSASLGGVVAALALVPVVTTFDGALNAAPTTIGVSAYDAAGDLIIAGAADPFATPLTIAATSATTPNGNETPATATFTIESMGANGAYAPTTNLNAAGAPAITKSSDIIVATYAPGAGTTSFSATVTVNAPQYTGLSTARRAQAASASYTAPPASATAAFVNPIFFQASNATAASSGTVTSTRPPAFAQNGANKDPEVDFTLAGQSITITPGESGTPATPGFTLTEPGCVVNGKPVVTVTPPSDGSNNYTVTAGTASGNTACSIVATDLYGGTATLNVTNTQSTSPTITIKAHTLFVPLETYTDPTTTYNAIGLFDIDNGLAQYDTVIDTLMTSPTGAARDSAGNLYVTDNAPSAANNNATQGQIVEFTIASAFQNEFVIASNLNNPRGIAFDRANDLYVAETGAARIDEYDAGTFSTTTAAAAPSTTMTVPYAPNGVAIDTSYRVFVSDSNDSQILRYDPLTANAPPALPATAPAPAVRYTSGVNRPDGIKVTSSGTLLVANSGGGNVLTFPQNGSTTAASTTATPGCSPNDAGIDASNNLFVSCFSQYLVEEFPGGNAPPTTVTPVEGTPAPAAPGAPAPTPEPTVHPAFLSL